MIGSLTPTLFLLRHAKSSWSDPTLPDHDRPLARRGRRACKLIAAYLRAEAIAPELVLCSSAVRARQTCERVAVAFPDGTEVRVEEALYGASADDLLELLHALPDSLGSVLLVGHDPAMQDLTLALAGPSALRDEVRPKFPTAALATLTLTTSWTGAAPATAELTSFVTPRGLD